MKIIGVGVGVGETAAATAPAAVNVVVAHFCGGHLTFFVM